MSITLRWMHQLGPRVYKMCASPIQSAVQHQAGHPALFLDNCRQCEAHCRTPSRLFATKKTKGALDHITVTTSNGKFPLNHLGQVSMKSPQLILVNMTSFPEATVAVTEAIRESGMNLNPEVDGILIRVPIPKVTREHRENLAKLAKQITNKRKESLRKLRTNAIAQVRKSKDSVSEDTIRLLEKQIQQMMEDITADMDKHLLSKTKELLG
ncbi:ribosome-recycling factor, mitochondrial isoform X2 [Narcine bancroftii]|uniref:ribosome-recycling factor, mitochondrial isoform X2 n=1 Tax=Narcine bancroftii TaxID=1343680 RepID=UPI003831C16B